jgi:hypothetical protein
MKVFLHIGLERTGSSSIQEWLAGRADRGEASYVYPQVGLVHYHHLELARALGFSDPSGPEAAGIPAAFRKEMLSARMPVVISSEHFSVNDSSEAIRRLADYLHGDDVMIVLFLRNQVSYLIGLYEEHVKWGGSLTLSEYYPDVAPFLSHERRLERWAEVFGVSAIKVLVYEDHADVIAAFAGAVLGETYVAPPRARLNPGLSQVFLEAVRRANMLIPEALRRQHFDRTVIALEELPGSKTRIWPLPTAFLDALGELDRENRRVGERFLDRRPKLFPQPLEAYAAAYIGRLRTPGPETEEAIGIISRLVAQP